MKAAVPALDQAAILKHCKLLRLPILGAQFAKLAEEVVREQHSHLRYLETLLATEVEERERRAIERRLQEARLPRVKTLDEFDFNQSPQIAAARIRELAAGGYIERAEPVVLLGECGTGKTHLAPALCVAAASMRRRHDLHAQVPGRWCRRGGSGDQMRRGSCP